MIAEEKATEPTDKMVAFFEKRTKEHIGLVGKYIKILHDKTDLGQELLDRAEIHDTSKYGPVERLPYIWNTEYHSCKRAGISFQYPEGMKEKVDAATKHHITTNRHHPEFHKTPSDMTDVDVAEMVADWSAMAEELDEGGPRSWADKTVGKRWDFDDDKVKLIYKYIKLVEDELED